ncbi:MAG: arginine deiminase-related protein [Gammaproteobacteria bacterium]|nr:arginine deiminase-related protein [Gammaproteobacteria bacterium]
MNNSTLLKCRIEGGNTPTLQSWGADCEYGILRDVLLGPADHYQWRKTSSISKKSIRREIPFNSNVVKQQHAEIISAFESAGVTVHFLKGDEHLPYQIFARDSSVMTPYGAIITNMANWWRRGEKLPSHRDLF